ncbi:MAG: hypothetical protein ACOX1A_06150 [Saccharofermentanales bacterium]
MSWDKLVEQVGLLWIILVLLAAGVLLLLLVFFLGNTGVAIRRALRRLSGLNTLFLEMAGCRIGKSGTVPEHRPRNHESGICPALPAVGRGQRCHV